MTRRDDSLIGQIVAANVVLVALSLLAASLAAGLDLTVEDQRWSFMVLALAIVLTLCVNLWMLQRRFRPLERLIDRVERIDPAVPFGDELAEPQPAAEIDRLAGSFRRLLDRIEDERRHAGTLVMRAQRRSAAAWRAICTTRSTRPSRRSCCGWRRWRRTPRPGAAARWPS